jgi:hypothetical protein
MFVRFTYQPIRDSELDVGTEKLSACETDDCQGFFFSEHLCVCLSAENLVWSHPPFQGVKWTRCVRLIYSRETGSYNSSKYNSIKINWHFNRIHSGPSHLSLVKNRFNPVWFSSSVYLYPYMFRSTAIILRGLFFYINDRSRSKHVRLSLINTGFLDFVHRPEFYN